MASGALLFSTNPFLKHFLQKSYRSDTHYVWCSDVFDSQSLAQYEPGRLVPPSSNPADIYRRLLDDCARGDDHSALIAGWRATFTALALDWHAGGDITAELRDEIVLLAKSKDFRLWRPLLYVIPRDRVANRLKRVPIERRAGLGEEYIIEDLKGSEFDILELSR